MKTALDLINEMDSEAPKFVHLRLVVCFEYYSLSISAKDPNRLAKLNDAIGRGGTPIGLLGTIDDGTQRWVYKRRLAEWSDHEEYIERFLRRAQKCLCHILGAKPRDGWINDEWIS